MNKKIAMGWIPDYPDFRDSGEAEDFGSVLKKERVNTGEFRI